MAGSLSTAADNGATAFAVSNESSNVVPSCICVAAPSDHSRNPHAPRNVATPSAARGTDVRAVRARRRASPGQRQGAAGAVPSSQAIGMTNANRIAGALA